MSTNIKNTWFFIVNPTADSGKAAGRWQQMKDLLAKYNIPYIAHLTTRRGDATETARNAVTKQGFRNIIAAGGDGTMNEVINGIFSQTTVPYPAILFSMLPIGTGNDWVKTHGISRDLTAFCEMLLRKQETLQDVGVIQYIEDKALKNKYFANAGGLGYDALVVRSVEKESGQRILPKKLSYAGHIFKCLYQFRPFRARVEVDNEVIDNIWYTLNFGIHRFSGAGMQLTPHAVGDDGLLSLTLVQQLSKWRVIKDMNVLYGGNIKHWRYAKLYQCKRFKITPLETMPLFVEADGEFLGEAPVEITLLHKVLRVVC